MPNKRCADFLNKLPDDEPAFTVRARDPFILDVIETWLIKAVQAGVNKKKIDHVVSIRDKEVRPWQKTHDMKIPD